MFIEDRRPGFGGKLRFLTVWCIILQVVYFGVAAIIDFTEKASSSGNVSQRTGLKKFRDVFHSSCAFPVATFVAVTFWTLYAVDKELIRPKSMDGKIPLWLTHTLHTTILPFIVVDKLFIHHIYPRRLYGILGTCGLSLLYLVWILGIAYFDDFWVYPVLQYMRAHERAVFIAVCLAFFSSFYLLGESLTTFIWGRKAVTVKKMS